MVGQLREIEDQIRLQRAQLSLERKKLKNLILQYALIDYRQDLEVQHKKFPTPVTSSLIDCINFLLGEK